MATPPCKEKTRMRAKSVWLPEGSEEGQAEAMAKDVNLSEDEEIRARTFLELTAHPMPPLDGLIKTLSRFTKLQKLDVSSMQPSEQANNPYGLSSLSWLSDAVTTSKKGKRGSDSKSAFGDRLTWLKCSDNAALGEQSGEMAYRGLERLPNLAVFNASSCALPVAPPPTMLLSCQSLAALILGHNNISELSHFPAMPVLNTLVLSHNNITSLPEHLPACLPSLKKISITHNKLVWDAKDTSPLPNFALCSHLREVRISGNTGLARLPAHLDEWGRGVGNDRKGTGLEILEAGDCGLGDWNAIAALLLPNKVVAASKEDMVHPSRRRVRGLSTLLLKGNDVAKLPGYRERVLTAHTGLRVLDSERLAPKADFVGAERPALEFDVGHMRMPKAAKRRSKDGYTEIKAEDKLLPSTLPSLAVETSSERVEVEKRSEPPPSLVVETRKEHKRGSRGKAKKRSKVVRDAAEERKVMRDPFLESVMLSSSEKKQKEERKAAGKKSTGGDVGLTRVQARAGPPSATRKSKRSKMEGGNASKTVVTPSTESSTGNAGKKRKAWDEGDPFLREVSKDGRTSEKERKSNDPGDGAGSKDRTIIPDKEETSVAGVVHVKTKRGSTQAKGEAATKKATPWDRALTDVSLGIGGAWD